MFGKCLTTRTEIGVRFRCAGQAKEIKYWMCIRISAVSQHVFVMTSTPGLLLRRSFLSLFLVSFSVVISHFNHQSWKPWLVGWRLRNCFRVRFVFLTFFKELFPAGLKSASLSKALLFLPKRSPASDETLRSHGVARRRCERMSGSPASRRRRVEADGK